MGKLARLVFGAVVGMSVGSSCGGGSGPPVPGVPFADGARLKAVHYQIDGAPPYFLGWYDSELGFDCSFVNERLLDRPVCFPSQPGQPTFANETYRFADSACTKPVVGTFSPGEARYFVRPAEAAGSPGCAHTPARLFHVGDLLPTGAALFLRDGSTGDCRPPAASEPVPYPELRLVGEEIPSDSLVNGTLGHESGSARIVPITITGSDGSMQGAIAGEWALAWDNARQDMATVPAPVPPYGRWYPAFSYGARFFSDAACSTRAALGSTCETGVKVASTAVLDGCGRHTPTEFFELGERLESGRTIYETPSQSTTCVPATGWPATDPTYAAYAVGSPIPLTSFAEAIEVPTGTERLRVVRVGSPGGPTMGAIGLFDSVLGKACGASFAAADGVLRCLPGAIDLGQTPSFADESCTVPLVVKPSFDDTCSPRPTFASLDALDQPGGTFRRHLYPIGEPYIGMVYLRLSDTTCLPTGTAPEVGETFATGPELPASSFAPVTLVHPDPSRGWP